jgi:hypothetical protein
MPEWAGGGVITERSEVVGGSTTPPERAKSSGLTGFFISPGGMVGGSVEVP